MRKKIAILTSKSSWFVPYAKKLVKVISKKGFVCRLFYRYEDIGEGYEIVFILSYFSIIKKDLLARHRHNIVVHESDLPKGKGWAPLFWQILEGKNSIPVVLFEATDKIDAGRIYVKDTILLKGNELYDEIREKQAEKTLELCLLFIKKHVNIKSKPQRGAPTYYKKRTPKDSELDLSGSLKDNFNLLRICNNNEFPAFFRYKNRKYIVRIFKG